MRPLFPILAFILSGHAVQAQSTSPVFKDCNCDIENLCNREQLEKLQDRISARIQESIPYHFNDSIYLEFSVNEDAELNFTSSFHLYSDYVLSETRKLLAGMSTAFCQSQETYSISFIYRLPDQLESYPEVERVKRPLPITGTDDFNLTARRAATRYLALNMSREIKEKRTPEGNHSGKIYLHEGNIAAIEFTSYDPETYFADSVAYYFYQANQELVDSKAAGSSDDLWISFEIAPARDSTERFAYGIRNLEFRKQLKNRKEYLSSLLQFAARHYSGKEKADFLYENLRTAGYNDSDQFRIKGTIYRVDSIASYMPPASDENEVLSFAVVEKVPVYQGCDKHETNEELRICFQRSILSHVGKSFNYPPNARQQGIQGRNYTSFVVEKDGSIGMVEVVRGVHPLLDLESIRVVSEIPDAEPATQRGKPVRMSFTLPINARLQ